MTVPRFPSAALGLDPGTPLERPGARGTNTSLIDLPTRAAARRGTQRRAALRSRSLRIGVPVALVVLWQLASSLQLVAPETLPPPTVIFAALKELIADGELQSAIGVSLVRAATGLAIGGGIGLIAGLLAGLWRIGEEVIDAPLQMLRTIPFIALIPLFITWFGIGEGAKVAVILAATIFPMYLNTYAGVRGVDPKLLEAASVFGLSGRQVAWRIILPTALPAILVGVRYASAVALLALVVAEQINAQNGIGYILVNANQNQRADIIIAGILVYATLGIVTDLVMRALEHLALPWRPRFELA
ncbi:MULTISPECIES: ABC transporter permease [unclassified Caballeronia]|uniref:ABC transporter permease n=1 Tax=unclassified Caballeronia TaxID=2646786 RepID=UPI002855F7BB|nr:MULTISPECIES: ABC transporter permease [unclassified Caballeronia]MDR5815514.1 ABC transporter permease [Caballeronia sp. LZ033]MDR5822086.1 ABC transporter permease [Caballeronia sp. LZ043]MDR5880242.1 ABC transporter permease [Caballeronia sp. LZ032]